MTLEWHGEAIVNRIVAAVPEAMVETVDAAIEETRAHTPVLTGQARDSVRHEGPGLSMTWGYHVAHGLWIEVGARGKAGVHAMRRAADHQYAKLPGRIAARSR